MQELWCSDKRDLVKWASLFRLATGCRASRVIQATFAHREAKPWKECNLLKSERKKIPFPSEVWEHFRSLEGISGLAKRTGIRIEVFRSRSRWSRESRPDYVKSLVRRLTQLKGNRLVVFLDPDTGIEPQRAGLNHVRKHEIKLIFAALMPGDHIVLYQHKRRTPDWIKETQETLASAVGLRPQAVQTFRYVGNLPALAKDVVFDVLRKL